MRTFDRVSDGRDEMLRVWRDSVLSPEDADCSPQLPAHFERVRK